MAAKENKTIKQLRKQIKKLNARFDDMNGEIESLRKTILELKTEASTEPPSSEDVSGQTAPEPSVTDTPVTEQMMEQTADMIDSAEEADELLENIESEAKEVCVLSGDKVEHAEEVAEAAEEAEELLEESARVAGQDVRLKEQAVEKAEDLAEDAEEVTDILEKRDR